jgi:hypothetical protein
MPGSFTSLAHQPFGGKRPGSSGLRSRDIPLENVGRRAAARLRLSIPATLVTLADTRRCILIDVSRTGAQVSLPEPLAVGEAGFLRFAGIEVFGVAIRAATGCNGLEFDVELGDDDVLAVRHHAESYEADARRALREEVRAWVTGT